MRLQLLSYVNQTVIDKVTPIAAKCDGKVNDTKLEIVDKSVFADEKFRVLDNTNFVTMEFIFNNLFDLNQFCYQAYMTFGYYFFIENVIFIPN